MKKYRLVRVSEENYLRLRRIRENIMERQKKDISFDKIIGMLLDKYEQELTYRW